MKRPILFALIIAAAATALLILLNIMEPQGNSMSHVALTNSPKPPSPAPSPADAPLIATLHYTCDAGKTIDAMLYDGSSTPPKTPDMPPTPGGSANISLSDGRSMHLPQTISGDGVRYANADESFIFWTKGNGAFVMEGNAQPYANCIQKTEDISVNTSTKTTPPGAMKIFTQDDNGSVIRLAKNEQFEIKLANTLSWKLSFAPANIITQISNATTGGGLQGIYKASEIGSTTLNAIGAPICKQNEACPQFRVSVKIEFVVGS